MLWTFSSNGLPGAAHPAHSHWHVLPSADGSQAAHAALQSWHADAGIVLASRAAFGGDGTLASVWEKNGGGALHQP